MTMKNSNHDQAKRLREKIRGEVEEKAGSLPPRSEVHKKKKTKKKVKMKYPLIRFLVILFILLPIMVLSILYYLEQKRSTTVEGEEENKAVIVRYSDSSPQNHEPVESGEGEYSVTEEMTSNNERKGAEPIQNEEKQAVESEGKTTESHEFGQDKNDVAVEEQPSKSESQGSSSSPKTSTKETKVITHVVKEEETLFRIAMKYYGSREGEDIIRRYNNLQGNDIYVGQKLKIPLH